jgi:glycosyltransferase involved in cell wall biosynthesis
VARGAGAAVPADGSWPRVSIVTASLNQAAFIEETIRSVLLQGYRDLEYIVMDGGSTDGTLDVIRRYEPWVALVSSGPDGGQTQAINAGWRRSSGEVLAWINADDSYLPGAVWAAVRALGGAPWAGMAYGDAIVVDERGRELRTWAAEPFTLEAMLGRGNVVPQPATFYARQGLEAVGYLDERWQMIMDYALAIRVGLGYPSICIAQPLARFRDHPTSKSRTQHGAMARELLRLVEELDDLEELGAAARPKAWRDLKAAATARIRYEWALACVVDHRPHEALRHLRRSLRADAGHALRRPVQTAFLAKEAGRALMRGARTPARRGDHPTRVQLIGRLDTRITGLARYTNGLRAGLEQAGMEVRLTFPMRPPLPTPLDRRIKSIGVDIGSFFASYPLRASLERADVYHLTDQMLATLLLFQRFPGPVVVTVMDIIPYLVQHAQELSTFRHQVDAQFYRLALAGLRRADALVVISQYTKATLVEVLGLPEERIHVIYPAIDHGRFRPVNVTDEFRERYGLARDVPYVLYVGSEDPRKNLSTLVRAIASVREDLPAVTLLKVGRAQFSKERKRLLQLIDSLGLEDNVRFMESVPDVDLPSFYNLAGVCVMPSLYEGFGLPMAEAMACGTPVIYARSGPLPEVAGPAGVQVHARDYEAFAQAITRLLADGAARATLADAGRRQAATFTWARTATETRALYARLLRASDPPGS